MARPSFAAQKAKIQKEMDKLRKQIALLESKNRIPVIEGIVRQMKEFEITPEEIVAAFGKTGSRAAGKTRNARKTTTGGARGPVAPKYRNPETNDQWTGRGKPPRWIVEAESQGKTREQFLIEQPATSPAV